MEKKNSFWNAFMRRGASMFLVIAMLITSVTLPEIDWQKGEASTMAGSLAPIDPVFSWIPTDRAYNVKSTNLTTSFVEHEDAEQCYLSIKNTTGKGVNLKNAYADISGDVGKATGSAERIYQKDKDGNEFDISVKVGDTFSWTTYVQAGGDSEKYLHCFENLWVHTNPKGMSFSNNTNSTNYMGIVDNDEGLLYLDDLFAKKGELNWIPPTYGTDYTGEYSGTRYAYFLVKYSAADYSPRMRVWAYGDQTLSSGEVYQQHRVSDEGLNNYTKHSAVTGGKTENYDTDVSAYIERTASDAQKYNVEQNIVYTEREFAKGDGNIQYQIIWVDVVRGGDAGRELDNFALEINGYDTRDFGLMGSEESADSLKDEEFRLYGVYGFNSENDALAYMYKDIFGMQGEWTDKAYRVQNFFNAPQKIAVGDTVNSHVNDTIPGVYMERGIYDYSNKTLVSGITSREEVFGTSSGKLLWKEKYFNEYMDGQVPHTGTGDAGYLETYKFTVDSNAKLGNYKYRSFLTHQSGVYNSDTYTSPSYSKESKIEIHAPLSLVEYKNDPSLSRFSGYEDALEGHTYYQYDMDFAFMDALYDSNGKLLDDWSIENFVYYLRYYDQYSGLVDEFDETQARDKNGNLLYNSDGSIVKKKDTIINSLPGFFHVSRGSMTFDLGPVITDNYEFVNIHYNKGLMKDFEGDITLTLYVTTFANQAAANAYAAGEEGAKALGVTEYKVVIEDSDDDIGYKTFTIPKYKAPEQDGTTVSGVSSVVQNYALRVDTGKDENGKILYNGTPLTEGFKIENIVFAERHNVDVTFKNELDRDQHNAWDYNNKAIGVNHKSVEKTKTETETWETKDLNTVAVKGAYGKPTDDQLKDGSYENTDNDPQNFSYYLHNLACDDHCQYITYDDSGKGTIKDAKENISVFAVQQSDYNFAYSIKLGKTRGVGTSNTDSLIDGLGHVNYKFNVAEDVLIDINVKWVNYANNIMAGMGVMDESGKVTLLPITSSTTSPEGTVSEDIINISTNTNGSAITSSTSTHTNAPTITSASYVKNSGKPKYYADGTVFVSVSYTEKNYATDIVLYYGDGDGKILDNYMHMQKQPLTPGTKNISFDLVDNTVIPAGAKSIIIFATNIYGRSAGWEIDLADYQTIDQHLASLGNEGGKLKTEFQVVSDTHIGVSLHNKRFEAMLKDIEKLSPNSIGIIIDGDVIDGVYSGNTGNLVNKNIDEQYKAALAIYNGVKGDNSSFPVMYWNIGNHEFYGGTDVVNTMVSAVSNSGGAVASLNNYQVWPSTGAYIYDSWVGGNHFIFLGSGTIVDNVGATLEEGQLAVLDNWLKDVAPTFVFCHQSINNTVAGSLALQGWDGIGEAGKVEPIEAQLASILSKYDHATYFSGHSHWDLNSVNTMYDGSFTAFNTGSVAYLWQTYGNTYSSGSKYENYESEGGSQGYYVEIYANGTILVRGRDFEAGKWLPSAYFIVEPVENSYVSGSETLRINKTEFEYGEEIIISSNQYCKQNQQALVIQDSEGNILQLAYPAQDSTGTMSSVVFNNEAGGGAALPALKNGNEPHWDNIRDMSVGKVFYSTENRILAPGSYTAKIWHVTGWNQVGTLQIPFTVKGTISNDKISVNVNPDDFDMHIALNKTVYEKGENIIAKFANVYTVNSVSNVLGSSTTAEQNSTKLAIFSADAKPYPKAWTNNDRTNCTWAFTPIGVTSSSGAVQFDFNSNNGGSHKTEGKVCWVGSSTNTGQDGVSTSSGLPEGKYYMALIGGESGYTILSEKVYFEVIDANLPGSHFDVTGAKNEYYLGEEIEISYTSLSGTDGAWIGIYGKNDVPGTDKSYQYAYICSNSGGKKVILFNDLNEKVPKDDEKPREYYAGDVEYTKADTNYLPVGEYKVLLYADKEFGLLKDTFEFTVKEPSAPEITIDKESKQFDYDEVIDVSYKFVPDTYGYWIGIFAANETTYTKATAIQRAYICANGTISFNDTGTTDELNHRDVNGVHVNDSANLNLPVGNYKLVAVSPSGKVFDSTLVTFSVIDKQIEIELKDYTVSENGTKQYNANYGIPVTYSNSNKGIWIGLFQENSHNPLQIAYTGESGTITFNPYFMDRTKNQVRLFDEDDINIVSHVSVEAFFLPEGKYFIQAFSGSTAADSRTHSVAIAFEIVNTATPSISPQYQNNNRVLDPVNIGGKSYENYLYYNNESVGVRYDGAAWGYWVSIYKVGEGPAYVGGKYNDVRFGVSLEEGADTAMLQRAYINGKSGYAKADNLVEFNNNLNFSGTWDTGTTDNLPFLIRHLNSVYIHNENYITLTNGEYYIVMCNDQGKELDRYYIKVVDRSYEDYEVEDPDADNPVTGMVGTWYSDAGKINIECTPGDKDTGVIEYSTKKTFTVTENKGYKFVGWYSLNSDGTVKSWISDEKVLEYYNFYTSQIIVYALFVKLDDSTAVGDDVNAYEVDFYNDAHQIVQSVPVLENGIVNISGLSYTPPIKVGYSFVGWNFPSAKTNGVTPVYYTANTFTDEYKTTKDSAAARFYVISTGSYDIVYAVATNDDLKPVDASGNVTEDPKAYVWKAAYLMNVKADVKVLAVWGPAGSGGVSSTAKIEYALYENGQLVDSYFSGAINVNAYVETDADVGGKKFIGWIDMKKGMTQSYVVGNTSGKVDKNIVSGEDAGNYDVVIYTNGTVNVGGTYYPIVSYKARYVFKITNNMDLRAVYASDVDLKASAKPAVTMSQYAQYADRGNGKVNVTVNAIVTLDTEATGYTLVEYGYLYYMVEDSNAVPKTTFYSISSDNKDGVIDTVEKIEVNFLSMSTVVPENENSKYAKLPINTCNSAGQYYGYLTTSAGKGKALYARPYAIYYQDLANGETAGENEDWTIAYGQTIKVDLSEVVNKDALYNDGSNKVTIFDEHELGTEDSADVYVNYPVEKSN